ncbi:hypothetical protein FJZ39_01265 [Candidatus Saccharibacteria bacterium]|nr:hypothetical protein [Candidatus Saccharibacteria bacterium]
MNSHPHQLKDNVKRSLELVAKHDPLSLESVDRTLNNPAMLASKYKIPLQYFNEIENRVEQNTKQIAVLLPHADDQTKEFIELWEGQELMHGAIFEQTLLDIGLGEVDFNANQLGAGIRIGGALSSLPGIHDTLMYLYQTTGAMHERLTAKGYLALIESLKRDNEFALAETAIKPILKQEGSHLGYYKSASLELGNRLAPWQRKLAVAIKTHGYKPVGAIDKEHEARFGATMEIIRGEQTMDEIASPVQKIAEEVLLAKQYGLELPNFVASALKSSINEARAQKLLPPDEDGLAVPVQ